MLGQARSDVNQDAALDFDWGPEQQPAQSPLSPDPPASPDSPEALAIESAASAERSTDSVAREGDAVGSYSSRGERRHRRSTQGANSATATNIFTHTPQHQPAPSQGFTALNRTPRNPGPQPRNAPAPEVPSCKRKAPTQKSNAQKTQPRTNSLKKRAPMGALTTACGVITPWKAQPKGKGNTNGDFCCPRCKGHFTRPKSVKDHFVNCVKKHGNPLGLRWFDHATLVKSRNYYENRRTAMREASEDEQEEEEAEEKEAEEEEAEEEVEEEEAEDDGDQGQDYEEEDFSEAYRERYGDEPGQEQDDGDEEDMQVYADRLLAHSLQQQDDVEEDDEESIFEEDWESAPGEDDQGSDTRVSA
ncbi:hypothetical protein BDR22DRAFT_498843 [Usnea florida]